MTVKHIEKSWISEGVSQETVNWAKEQGQFFAEGRDKLTTSQLRKFFGELKRIQALGYDNAKADFLLLQAKLAYAVGRERKRGGNAGKIEDFAEIISKGIQQVNTKKEYQNFIDITEAVVAYHKFFEDKK